MYTQMHVCIETYALPIVHYSTTTRVLLLLLLLLGTYVLRDRGIHN